MVARLWLSMLVLLPLAGCIEGDGSDGGNFFEEEGETTVQPGMRKGWVVPADETADIHPRVTGINGKNFDLYIMTLEQYNAFISGEEPAVVSGSDGPCKVEDTLTTAAPCRDLAPGSYHVIVDNTESGEAQPDGPLLIDYSIEARPA